MPRRNGAPRGIKMVHFQGRGYESRRSGSRRTLGGGVRQVGGRNRGSPVEGVSVFRSVQTRRAPPPGVRRLPRSHHRAQQGMKFISGIAVARSATATFGAF